MPTNWEKELSRCVSWEEVNDLILERVKDPDKAEKIIDKIWLAMLKVIKDECH